MEPAVLLQTHIVAIQAVAQEARVEAVEGLALVAVPLHEGHPGWTLSGGQARAKGNTHPRSHTQADIHKWSVRSGELGIWGKGGEAWKCGEVQNKGV